MGVQHFFLWSIISKHWKTRVWSRSLHWGGKRRKGAVGGDAPPPPAGGGPGVSPGFFFLENCFKMVHSGRIWGVIDAHFTTGNLYKKICVSKFYTRIWRASFLEMLVFSLLRNFIWTGCFGDPPPEKILIKGSESCNSNHFWLVHMYTGYVLKCNHKRVGYRFTNQLMKTDLKQINKTGFVKNCWKDISEQIF